MKYNVKVITGSSKSEIVNEGDVLKAYVRAKPDKGKANKEVVGLIAERFNVPKNMVRIVSGVKSRKKIVEVMKDV